MNTKPIAVLIFTALLVLSSLKLGYVIFAGVCLVIGLLMFVGTLSEDDTSK